MGVSTISTRSASYHRPYNARFLVGRRCSACCPAWRWLDANHGSRRAGGAEAGGVERTAQVIRTRSCEVRYRGLARMDSPAPKIGRLRRTVGVDSVLTW